jgi:MoaA/NifB/PqqE/SkfB family radical SAM enzyme
MPNSADKLANIRAFHEEINSPRADGSTSNAPLLLAIEVTTRCNFKCVHCCHRFSSQKPAGMSLELFQDIVPLLKTAHELYLFGDGEVLLDIPRHLAMIARTYQEDPTCALGFSTNGKLLTPEVFELYATAGVQYIQISVDAAIKSLYEEMRRGGSFDQLLANLEGIAILRQRSQVRQPQLRLATVISKQNFRQLPILAEFAKKYGFSSWYVNAECPLNPGRDLLQLTSEDLAELDLMRADILQNYNSCFSTVFDPHIGLSARTDEKWLESTSPVFCTVPWQRFEVKVNGDVKVCPYYHEAICSMQGKSAMDVWNGEEFRRIRRAFTVGRDIPSYCVDCKFGMKKQYLPGYPGLPNILPLSPIDRAIRRVRAMKQYLSR